MRKSFRKNLQFRLSNILIKIGVIWGVSFPLVFGANELPEGMLPYGIPRTALERVNREMNDFPLSEEADQFTPNYDAICRHIRTAPATHGVDELLRLVHSARQAASNARGEANNWECKKLVCAGHTLDKKYDSKDEAQSAGQTYHREYANKADIDSSSLQLYEVRQHGSKTEVAIKAGFTAPGYVAVAVGAAGVGAAIATGGMAIPFMLTWEAGAVWWTASATKITKDAYDNIWYNMSLFYKHKDDDLKDCDNKKYETFLKSTTELLKAIDSLGVLVRIFKLETEIIRLGQETPAMRTELQNLQRQLSAFN